VVSLSDPQLKSASAIGPDESDAQGSDKETRDPQQKNLRKGLAGHGDSAGEMNANASEQTPGNSRMMPKTRRQPQRDVAGC
jgi:hypothetical protein